MIAIDASALIALMRREPGHELVRARLDGALVSTVNLAEVGGYFARQGLESDAVITGLRAWPIELVPFSEGQARLAAGLSEQTRRLGLSLGDRACLALALERGVGVLTGDRLWARLKIGVEVTLIR